MDDEISKMLCEEIKTELSDLSILDTGSKEKSAAIDDLVQLYKIKIEDAKTELELKKIVKEIEDLDQDNLQKAMQLSEQQKDRNFGLAKAVLELIVPLIFYGVWMNKGFKFEENGTYNSWTFKNFISRIKPTKR